MIIGCVTEMPEGMDDWYFNVYMPEMSIDTVLDGMDKLIDHLNMQQVELVDRVEYIMTPEGELLWHL